MTVAPNDRGLALGDGIFETVLAEEGRLAHWVEHVARLQRGCAALGLPTPDASRLHDEAMAALAREGLESARAAVRLTWTAGPGGRGLDRPREMTPDLVATAAGARVTAEPARLATSTIRRNETSPASRLKTLSYLDQVLARREAAASGGDEALMLNSRGEIACAAAANVFWIAGGVIHTPALDCGVLDGIIRQSVLDRAPLPVRERHVGPDALLAAEAVFLTNSLIGLRPVSQVDGRAVGGEALVREIARAVL